MSHAPTGTWALRLFLPFAAGYFLSYLYRTANAVLGPVIAGELQLPDQALGLLTSTYFLAFGAAQLPLGMALDRFGARRVEATLLLVAALGTAVFSLSDTLTGLAIGRGLVGLGVAACLMASLKAFSQWFGPDRQAALTGWIMAAGGLGAIAASKPLSLALSVASWREIGLALALLTILVAALLYGLVPEKPGAPPAIGWRAQWSGLKQIYGSRHFWRYAPLAFWLTGGFMALQGLWVSRWMRVSEGLSDAAIANRLTLLSAAMLGGFLFLGFFATRLIRRGVRMDRLYALAMLVSAVCLGVLLTKPQLGAIFWPLLGACFSLSNMAYSLVAQAFPLELAGRANTALNLVVFAGAFSLQWGIGLGVDALQAGGQSAGDAYQAAFLLLLGGQALSLLWLFVRRDRRV